MVPPVWKVGQFRYFLALSLLKYRTLEISAFIQTLFKTMDFAAGYPRDFVPDFESDFLESLVLAKANAYLEENDWFDECNRDLNSYSHGDYENISVNESDQLFVMDGLNKAIAKSSRFSNSENAFHEPQQKPTSFYYHGPDFQSNKTTSSNMTIPKVQAKSTCSIPKASDLLAKALKVRSPHMQRSCSLCSSSFPKM
jgi:hypothetical protein